MVEVSTAEPFREAATGASVMALGAAVELSPLISVPDSKGTISSVTCRQKKDQNIAWGRMRGGNDIGKLRVDKIIDSW
jgi:hypothetical protein